MIVKALKNIVITFLITLVLSLHINAEQKTLTVGVYAHYPPFAFTQKGEIVGFEIDLITIIANNLGYNLEFEDMEFKELFPALKNREIDLAVAGISVTKEREKTIGFSSSYYFPKLTILTMEGTNINSLKDLRGKIVAAQSGTTMEEFLIRTFSVGRKIKVMSFINMDFMLKALKNGQINAILTEDAVARHEQTKDNDFSYFIIKHSKYSLANSYAIALPRDSDLKSEINDELLKLKMSDQFSILQEKWGIK